MGSITSRGAQSGGRAGRPMGITAIIRSGIYKVLSIVPREEPGPECSQGNAFSHGVWPHKDKFRFFLLEK